MEISDWVLGWGTSCGFRGSPAVPVQPYESDDDAPVVPALDTTFVVSKLRGLAAEGLTIEVHSYLDRLGIAIPVGGAPIKAALAAAVEWGHLFTVHLLVRWHGGSLTEPLHGHEATGDTPLIVAAKNNHHKLCTYILHRGAPLDVTNRNGWSAIHFAAAEGNLSIVQLLLDHGADPLAEAYSAKQQDSLGEIHQSITPLQLAQDGGHPETALALRTSEPSSEPIVLCMQRWLSSTAISYCAGREYSFVRGLGIYVGTMAVFCAVSVRVSIAFAVAWYLLSQVCHTSRGKTIPKAKQMHGKESMGVFFAALGTGYSVWALQLSTQIESRLVTVIFWILSVVMIVSYAFSSNSDPGRIECSNLASEDAFIDMLQEHESSNVGSNFPSNLTSRFCGTCQMLRPLRAKHCSDCGCCVREFDHHCPGIGNCIGIRNRWSFVVFLASIVTIQVIFEWAAIGHLSSVTLPHIQQSEAGGKSGEFFLDSWNRLQFITEHDKLVLFTCIFQGMSLLVLGGLFIFHCYLIARNMTTNEMVNWQKYEEMLDENGGFHNPRDQGTKENCIRFWARAATQLLRPSRMLESQDYNDFDQDIRKQANISLSRSMSVGDLEANMSLELSSSSRSQSCRRVHRRSSSMDFEEPITNGNFTIIKHEPRDLLRASIS